MDPQHLRYFLAIVDSGSVTGAAAALGVAPPSVSQGLRALERDVAAALFRRVGRGMVPTSAGHALVTPARRVLKGLARASTSLGDPDATLRGQLDVRSHPALATGVVTRTVTEFRRRYPQVSVSVGSLDDDADPARWVARAICDVVVSHLPLTSEIDGVEIVELGRQEYWLAFPPDADLPAPLSHREWLTWDEIDADVISVPARSRQRAQLFQALSPAQQLRRPVLVLKNHESRLAFTAAGVGATWLERAQAEGARRSGLVVRELRPPLGAAFGLVHSPATASPAAAAFVQVAAETP